MTTPTLHELSTLPDKDLIDLAIKHPFHSEWKIEAYRYLAFRIAMVQGIVVKDNKTN